MVLTILMAAVGLTQWLAPEWVHHAGLDVWTLATDHATWHQAREESLDLEAKAAHCAQRCEAGAQIAAQLAAADITLPAAADNLALLFADEGSQLCLKCLFHAAPTDRHVFALHAAARVGRIRELGFTRMELIFMRLEAEYRTLNPRGELSLNTAPMVTRIDEMR